MDRFKIEYSEESIELYHWEVVTLCIRIPYRNCFGKLTYKYQEVYSLEVDDLARRNVITKSEIKDFMMKSFIRSRARSKSDRNIRRNLRKKLK